MPTWELLSLSCFALHPAGMCRFVQVLRCGPLPHLYSDFYLLKICSFTLTYWSFLNVSSLQKEKNLSSLQCGASEKDPELSKEDLPVTPV